MTEEENIRGGREQMSFTHLIHVSMFISLQSAAVIISQSMVSSGTALKTKL